MVEIIRSGLNVDEMHSNILARQQRDQAMMGTTNVDVARAMVARMSDGDTFDYKSFLFAASLGEPDRYPDETTTLGRLADLVQGETVAVTNRETIRAIGQAARIPFVMNVDAGTAQPSGAQDNRLLTASLQLAFGMRRAREDKGFPYRDIGPLETDPSQVLILSSFGEPLTAKDGAYDQSHKILVGVVEIVEFAARYQNDDLAMPQLGAYIAELENRSLATRLQVESVQ